MKNDSSAPSAPFGGSNPPLYTEATNPGYPQGYNNPPPMQQPYYGPPPTGPGQQNYGQPSPGMNTTNSANVTVVSQAPAATMLVQHFRESPMRINCSFCKADVVTATNYEVGTITWVIAGVIFLVGCVAGCCLIPFCIDGCKDVIHTCPNCRQIIGRYNRM